MIKKEFNQFFPGNPFDYFFLDDYYNQQYKSDELFGKVVGIFTFLALFVTCLGILGLSSFMAIKRTKEIGIRKVLGASVINILSLLTREVIILIIVASLIAVPLTYYYMNNWLMNFAYRINISWLIFILAILSAMLIALLTVCYQSFKVANAKPVNTLRYE